MRDTERPLVALSGRSPLAEQVCWPLSKWALAMYAFLAKWRENSTGPRRQIARAMINAPVAAPMHKLVSGKPAVPHCLRLLPERGGVNLSEDRSDSQER